MSQSIGPSQGGDQPRKQNHYTPEFRQRAIELVTRKKYTVQQAAESLGVKFHTMDYWVREHRKKNRVERAMTEGDKDQLIDTLQKELAELRQEKEILKKAAAYFAKESR